MNQKPSNKQSQGEKCPICMNRFVNSRLNNCNHQFCFTCINRWSKKRNSCPNCRQGFQLIYTKKVFPKNSKLYKEGRIKQRQEPAFLQQFMNSGALQFNYLMPYWPGIQFFPMQFFSMEMNNYSLNSQMPNQILEINEDQTQKYSDQSTEKDQN